MSKKDPPVKTLLGGAGKTAPWLILILCILANLAITNPSVTIYINRAIKHLGFTTAPAQKSTAILGASDAQITDTERLQSKYDYWRDIVASHPDYRDGHYMAAIIAYQMENITLSRAHLDKVKNLDPNFPGTSQLEMLFPEQ